MVLSDSMVHFLMIETNFNISTKTHEKYLSTILEGNKVVFNCTVYKKKKNYTLGFFAAYVLVSKIQN